MREDDRHCDLESFISRYHTNHSREKESDSTSKEKSEDDHEEEGDDSLDIHDRSSERWLETRDEVCKETLMSSESRECDRKDDEKECECCPIIKKTLSFEYECESPRSSHFFEEGKDRYRVRR